MSRYPRGQARAKVFDFVRQRLLAGQPPTVREVQAALGFKAVESARSHLEALVGEGKLRKEAGLARGYRLAGADHTPPLELVPLLGRVQAGALTTALEEPLGYVPLHSRRAGRQLFALKVCGDSMRDAGIMEDDVVIVCQQPSADSGDIVVALVDDEATVKRLVFSGDKIRLEPANSRYTPMVMPADAVQILGKVVELRRHYEGAPIELVG